MQVLDKLNAFLWISLLHLIIKGFETSLGSKASSLSDFSNAFQVETKQLQNETGIGPITKQVPQPVAVYNGDKNDGSTTTTYKQSTSDVRAGNLSTNDMLLTLEKRRGRSLEIFDGGDITQTTSAPQPIFDAIQRMRPIEKVLDLISLPLFNNVKDDSQELLSGSSFALSNVKRNLIVSYRDFAPFHIIDRMLQRDTVLKSVLHSLKLEKPMRSIYLENLQMEILEVPEKSSISEVMEQILMHTSLVENVHDDEETDIGEIHGNLTSYSTVPRVSHGASPSRKNTSFQSRYDTVDSPDDSGILRSYETASDYQDTYTLDEEAPTRNLEVAREPNDENFHRQWAFRDTGDKKWGVDVQPAWRLLSDFNTKRKKIVIALIDSGVDLSHPDLRKSIWRNKDEICGNGIDDDNNGFVDDCYGWNFVKSDNYPMDDNGHGTASAGILAAQSDNRIGVTGICWNCELMVLKALNEKIKGTVSGFVRAIDYALGKGAKLSNNSYGGRGSTFSGLYEAVRRASDKGMIFVAAAGNYNDNNDNDVNPVYPASYDLDNVISVAAITRQGPLAHFSSYGKSSVHIAAPGEQIFSTFTRSSYRYFDGTSFAVPFVTGAAALIWSAYPQLSHTDVVSRIIKYQKTSPFLEGMTRSSGVVNIWAALTKYGTGMVQEKGSGITRSSCASESLCDDHAICTDNEHGTKCECKQGFEGDGYSCFDVDECTSNPCGKMSTCRNTVGSFECSCVPGFKRIDNACEDLNECEDTMACPTEAKCYNLLGSYDCICPEGHYWNRGESGRSSCAKLTASQRGACLGDMYCGLNSVCTDKRTFWSYSSACECLPGYELHLAVDGCVPVGILDEDLKDYASVAKAANGINGAITLEIEAPKKIHSFCFLGVCLRKRFKYWNPWG